MMLFEFVPTPLAVLVLELLALLLLLLLMDVGILFAAGLVFVLLLLLPLPTLALAITLLAAKLVPLFTLEEFGVNGMEGGLLNPESIKLNGALNSMAEGRQWKGKQKRTLGGGMGWCYR